MNHIQDELENSYYKLAIIDRKYKSSFLDITPKDAITNINSLICQEGSPSSEFNFENLFSRCIESKSDIVCFFNFEILFRHDYRFDLLSFLKERSKSRNFAIIWPGEIQKNHLLYSRPGRPDYYTHNIDNYLIYKEEQ